jgi:hypothetical protein
MCASRRRHSSIRGGCDVGQAMSRGHTEYVLDWNQQKKLKV